MSRRHKVVWHEGMFLTPHHFQQWDGYYDQLLHERLRAVSPFGWGVSEVRLDVEDLANGIVRMVSLQGVMPDGTFLTVVPTDPDNGAIMQPRSIDRCFPPSLDHLDVLVGVPVERPDGPNWIPDETGGTAPTRYVGLRGSVPDLNSGEKRELLFARENLRLLFSGEETSGFITLKVAELERASGGKVASRESYVPPCLSLSASPWLLRLLRGLLELVSAKRNALAAQQHSVHSTTMDQVRYSRLHILNAHLPVLAHHHHLGHAHPESLYLALAKLAGELSTVCPALDPMELPKYDHFNLGPMFRQIDLMIRQALQEEETRVETIRLTLVSDCVWQGIFSEEQLQSGQLYLVALGGLTDDQIPSFVRYIRIASQDEVENIVSGAVDGLRITHVAGPPPTMPVKAGCRYFRLEKQGALWAGISRARAIGLYVPPEFKDAKLELAWTK